MKAPLPLAKLHEVGDESEWRGLPQCRFRPTHVIVTNGRSDGVELQRLVLVGEALMRVVGFGVEHKPTDEEDRSYDLSALKPLTAGQWRLPDDVGWQWAARFIVLRIKGHTGPDGSIVILGDVER